MAAVATIIRGREDTTKAKGTNNTARAIAVGGFAIPESQIPAPTRHAHMMLAGNLSTPEASPRAPIKKIKIPVSLSQL
jgi:hypothetical protein